jgi:hypothetical protein
MVPGALNGRALAAGQAAHPAAASARPGWADGGSAASGPGARMQVSASRPGPHTACDVHDANGYGYGNGEANGGPGDESPPGGPYDTSRYDAAAAKRWTPWQRLLAVLLVQGLVPGLSPRVRVRGRQPAAHADADGAASSADAPQRRNGAGPSAEGTAALEGDATPSPIDSEADEPAVAAHIAADLLEARGVEHGPSPGPLDPCGAAEAAVVDGARIACYGLLLPILHEATETDPRMSTSAGSEASDGKRAGAAGAAASAAVGAAVGGRLLRRLCPLRESLATVKTLLCDSEANQAAASAQGLIPVLVQVRGWVSCGSHGLCEPCCGAELSCM